MATDTAAETTTRPVGPDPATYVWQVPMLILGILVFVSAWQGWLPLGTPDPVADFDRDILALRSSFEKVTPDRDELKELLAKVAAEVDGFPAQAPAARFALGSGYARLAELTPIPEEARAHWTLARQHFELVRSEQLRDQADGPRLAFRSAKARAAVGLPANTSIADVRLHITLLANVPFGEEAGESGRIAADLALRLNPPDLATARDNLERYLRSTGVATPTVSLARGRLQLGEIYVRLRQSELAKNRLEQIGIDAPIDVLAPAKVLLARVKMTEDDWLGAARELEAMRVLQGVAQPLRISSAYYLGICKANTREPEAAIKLFEEAVKGDGLESRAAAVRLAELYLKGGDPARRLLAPDLLATALKGPIDIKELRSHPDLRPDYLQPVFELAISVLTTDGAYEPALKTLDLYAPLSVAGREREKRAEVLESWAKSLQQKNGAFKPKASAAAAEYEAIASLQPAATAKADVYRRAAAMYRLAGEPAKTVDTLQKVIQLPQLPDAITGPVWMDLVDALVAANRPDEIWPALNRALATTSVSTATRHRLATQFVKAPRPELAALGRQLYEQIAKQETVAPADQEFHELALSDLTHELIKSNNFTEAEVWAKKQIGIYPSGPESGLGRLFLGICLLQRAAAPATAGSDPAAAARTRDEALALFKKILVDIEAKLSREKKLADRDQWLRLQAGLRVLQTYQQMQRPNDLLAEAAPLLERHRGTVEELIIWSLVYHAFRQKNETGKALQTRDQMKDLFDRLPPDKFRAREGEYSRAYWEKVWFSPDPKPKG